MTAIVVASILASTAVVVTLIATRRQVAKERGERKMELIISAIIIASATVVVTLIATRR